MSNARDLGNIRQELVRMVAGCSTNTLNIWSSVDYLVSRDNRKNHHSTARRAGGYLEFPGSAAPFGNLQNPSLLHILSKQALTEK